MESTQTPFFCEFPEGKGDQPGHMGRKSHGQLRSYHTKRHLGGREPDTSHANLAL